MSLSSLLDKLTGLVSKNFVLAAFVPTLAFAFLNGALLYLHVRWFRHWASSQIVSPRVFDITIVALGLAIAAYMLASVSLFLRQVLEGKRLLPLWPWLERLMRTRQQRRFDVIWKKYTSARDNHLKITAEQKRNWQKELRAAAKNGSRGHANTTSYQRITEAAKRLAELRGKRAATIPPSYAELEEAVDALRDALGASDETISRLCQDKRDLVTWIMASDLSDQEKVSCREQLSDAEATGMRNRGENNSYDFGTCAAQKEVDRLRQAPQAERSSLGLKNAVSLMCKQLMSNNAAHSQLREDWYTLLRLFDYAERAWGPLEVRYFNERQSGFGAGYVAPTAMGNVAESMQNYALSRYGLNLETFWTRLQIVVQPNKDFYSVLQDAKTQLDFLVACCWLSAITWILWTVALPFVADSLWLYLTIALAGPVASYFFYALGTTNYASLADLVSTMVDLYRFSLLQALHIPLPKGARQERALWGTLQDMSSFGQEVELGYTLDQKGPVA